MTKQKNKKHSKKNKFVKMSICIHTINGKFKLEIIMKIERDKDVPNDPPFIHRDVHTYIKLRYLYKIVIIF